jgi:hypothetical protein
MCYTVVMVVFGFVLVLFPLPARPRNVYGSFIITDPDRPDRARKHVTRITSASCPPASLTRIIILITIVTISRRGGHPRSSRDDKKVRVRRAGRHVEWVRKILKNKTVVVNRARAHARLVYGHLACGQTMHCPKKLTINRPTA